VELDLALDERRQRVDMRRGLADRLGDAGAPVALARELEDDVDDRDHADVVSLPATAWSVWTAFAMLYTAGSAAFTRSVVSLADLRETEVTSSPTFRSLSSAAVCSASA